MTSPHAVAPIATLPIFFKLGGRRVLLAGGTPPAVWKAELLAAAGAEVRVLAAHPCDAMTELASALPDRLRLELRDWRHDDFRGMALAIGGFEDEASAATFRDAARAAGVPVNVIDVPPLCDFQFGTIVERSPLVIGISTDGAAPVLGQALRARIEALLPPAMGAWAEAAKAWRIPLQALKLGFGARRKFWECFAEMALEGGDREPLESDRLTCLDAALGAARSPDRRILLVGAGPGDADLVTLQAIKAMQSADVIVFEPGTPPGTLGLGRREAIRMPAGTDRARLALEDAARTGSTVAWVGPGDPATCPAWESRRQALAALNLETRIIRGLACGACPHGCAAG